MRLRRYPLGARNVRDTRRVARLGLSGNWELGDLRDSSAAGDVTLARVGAAAVESVGNVGWKGGWDGLDGRRTGDL